MNTTKQVQKIPYKLYYFSRHLEHIIFNEQNPNDDEKFEAVENFLEELDVPVEEFLKNYLPILSEGNLEEKYIESWHFKF